MYLWGNLLFVHGDARAESNRSCMEHRSGAPFFLYAVIRILKVIEVVWNIDREPLAFYTRDTRAEIIEAEWHVDR
jgi:hypothetical protein